MNEYLTIEENNFYLMETFDSFNKSRNCFFFNLSFASFSRRSSSARSRNKYFVVLERKRIFND